MSISLRRFLFFAAVLLVLVALLAPSVESAANETHSGHRKRGHYNSTHTLSRRNSHPGKWFKGRITWYDTKSYVDSGGFIGSCGKSIKSGFIKGYPILAMNRPQLKGGKSCGDLIELYSPIKKHKRVTFVVADECPECPKFALDLARVEFDRIANDDTGVYRNVKWRFSGKKIKL